MRIWYKLFRISFMIRVVIFDDVFRWRFGCRKEKGKIKRKRKQRCDVTNEGKKDKQEQLSLL